MQKAVSYARVSSTEQEETGYSLDAQDQLFHEYAVKQRLNIVKKFKESQSAKGSGRKKFSEMIEYVKDNCIDVILFEKADRMTRNFHDLIEVYNLIESHDVSAHLIKNSLILNKESKASDTFQLDIQVVIARNYINNLSEEAKKGMKQKLAQGGWCHVAPYGYRNIKKEGRATIEPNPGTADIVRRAFDLASSGHSASTIAKRLTEIDQGRRKWYASTVHHMLKNPFYIGQMVTKSGTFEGSYETLVSKSLFYRVQDTLSKKNKLKTKEKHVFRYSGLLFCSCGAPMYGELKKGKYVTYGCGYRFQTHQKGHAKCEAKPRYISESKINAQVVDALSRIKITKEKYDYIKEVTNHVFEQINAESDAKQDKLNREIKIKKGKLGRLLDHYDDGMLTKDEYFEKKDELQKDIAKMQAEFEAVIDTPIEYRTSFLSSVKALIGLSEYIERVQNVENFRKIMKSIYSNLVHDAGIVRFTASELGEMLLDFSEQPIWLPQSDAFQIHCRMIKGYFMQRLKKAA